MNVLVCAQSFEEDPHISRVCHHINRYGGNYFFFERYRDDHFFSFNSEQSPILELTAKERKLISDQSPDSVYWRIKPVISSELPYGQTDKAEIYCAKQWMSALEGIVSLYRDQSFWLNNLRAIRESNNKIAQLKAASDLGFTLPKTIITNDVSKILEFFNSGESIIFKLLAPFMTEKENVFTNEVSLEWLEKRSPSIAMAPTIFQEKIEKNYEVRVTVIGNDAYALRIDMPDKVDWRVEQSEDMFLNIINVPEAIKKKLVAFQNKFGLVYGAYDFIVDVDGEYIFLECNPCGQWYFSEEIGEIIAKKIALSLLHRDSN